MLKIPKTDLDQIRTHGEEACPNECCGVLIGKLEDGTRVVKGTIRCQNGQQDRPTHRYNIAAEELIAAQKRPRDGGFDIIGFCPSRPALPSRWSRHDLEEAHWFPCSYVITSVEGGKASRSSSFAL